LRSLRRPCFASDLHGIRKVRSRYLLPLNLAAGERPAEDHPSIRPLLPAWLFFSVCRQCSDRACRDGFPVVRSLERHLDPKWPFHLVLTEQPVPPLFFYYSRRLESATRSLKISAPQRVVIESWANEISASCLTDLKLQSVHGAIRLDAKSVYVKGLKTAIPVQGHSSREQQQQQQQQHSGRSSSAHQSQRDTSIYQLCACASGKLFLARPDGNCQADKSIC